MTVLLAVVVVLVAIPFVVYLSVKLGTYAQLKARYLFFKTYGSIGNGEVEEASGGAEKGVGRAEDAGA